MLTIDYNNIINILPSVTKRTIKRLDWLKLQVYGLKQSHNVLHFDFDEYEFIAAHNYQVASMEHFLNTYLEPLDTISILEGTWIQPTFLFIQGETFDVPIYIHTQTEAIPLTLYTTDEFVSQQVDFIVNVSTADVALEDKIKYWINYYKQAGKKYIINYY